jgi:hypothetical protein
LPSLRGSEQAVFVASDEGAGGHVEDQTTIHDEKSKPPAVSAILEK